MAPTTLSLPSSRVAGPPHRSEAARRGALALLLAAATVLSLFQAQAQPKPSAEWHLLDLAGEGGTALMAALWCLLVLAARPDGRVTRLIAGGLAGLALGAWTDCLDECFRLPAEVWWDNLIEGVLPPTGMLALTLGLLDWRAEQQRLSEHLLQRERLWRDHRCWDRITELADAAYLREQLQHELRQRPGTRCALLMLQTDRAATVAREHGPAEADRLLQALAHLLLLNLRCDDLLCRYAGDRFCVLLPGRTEAAAHEAALALERAVAGLHFHSRTGEPIGPLRAYTRSTVLCGGDALDVDAAIADLLHQLGRAAEPGTSNAPTAVAPHP
jgi:diguanylate cyclase (GGDEF)-like protein